MTNQDRSEPILNGRAETYFSPPFDDAANDAYEQLRDKPSYERTSTAKGKKAPIWTPAPIDSTTFASSDYRHDWLIKNLIVTKEPVIIFGASKTLKTSIVIDIGVSLATGMPALGCFEVPHSRRVLIISGESGPASLQSVARRVCESKGIDLAGIGDKLHWEFSVPPLSDPLALVALHNLLSRYKCEIVVVDPAYLALLAGGNASADKAANMFHMGPLLSALVDACNTAGSQLLLIHHTNTKIEVGQSPELAHLAFAGFQQFARQWIGLNRIMAFSQDGKNALVMVAGGSAGHSGKWACSIDEGKLAEDFTGRRWDVTVELYTEAKAREKEEKLSAREEKKAAKLDADLHALLNAVKDIAADAPEMAATKSKIRAKLGWNNDTASNLIRRALMEKQIEERPVIVCSGRNGKSKKPTIGYAVIVATEINLSNANLDSDRTDRTDRTDGTVPTSSDSPDVGKSAGTAGTPSLSPL